MKDPELEEVALECGCDPECKCGGERDGGGEAVYDPEGEFRCE